MFLGFIAVTLWITWWAARKSSGSSAFFAAGRSLKAWQNGIAVAGDYMSAASFLGIAGIIAFQGYDGFMYSVGWLVAYLTVLLDRRRAAAQRGQVHDGRRARVSLEPAAGARDGRAVDADREHVLHDRADGRRGRPRVAAAARHGHHVSNGRHRHRRADDRVRGVRRNARDHLGADRQSHPADGRHDSAQHPRARPLRLQL